MERREYPLPRMNPRFAVYISRIHGQDSGSVDGSSLHIVYVLQGASKLRVEGREQDVRLGEQDFVLLNPQETYEIESEAGGLAARFELSSVSALFGGRDGFRFDGGSSVCRRDTDERVREILADLLRRRTRAETECGDPAGEARLTFELLYLLLGHYLAEAPKPEPPSRTHKPSKRLLEICAYLQANYRRPLTLSEVADDHYVSVPYLSKSFKKEIGMTFSDYLNRIRLDHAMTQLLHTDQPVTRIAFDSGFPSLTAFNRVFREINGLTPSQYRRAALAPGGDSRANGAEALGTEAERRELEALLNARRDAGDQVTVLAAEMSQPLASRGARNELINVGYAGDLLHSGLQEQLTSIRGELGFGHARIWGIFGPEMMIEDPADPSGTYNFGSVDKVLDALLRARLVPYLELGDKPKLIHKNISEKMGTPPETEPRDRKRWGRILRAFLIHCINRYGKEEVERWTFELWHASKHAFLREGVDRLVGQGYRPEGMEPWFDDYFARFDLVWREIKTLLPEAKLGGCGLSMDLEGRLLPLLLERWKHREIRPDFLTVYLYPYEFRPSGASGEPAFVHAADERWILHTIREIRRVLNEHGLGALPLHVTEWNFSVSNRDFRHDSLFKASYILKNVTDAFGEDCLMGYWLYSDIFSEFRDSKRPLYGGAGLVSKNGIKKPAFHAFAFLNRMGDQLIARGDAFVLTRRGEGQYQLLLFRSLPANPDVSPGQSRFETVSRLERQAAESEARLRRFRLEGLKNGSYRLKRSTIGADRGSVLREWEKFGATDDIRPDELSFLERICVPELSVEQVEVKDGTLDLDSRLRPYETQLIEWELKQKEG